MRSGKLRHRLTYQEPTETADELGQPVVTWSTIVIGIPAEVRGLTSREAAIAEQTGGRASLTVSLRYRDDIRSLGRFLWNGRTLNIAGNPIADPRQRELAVPVTETG
jgi:SPP1 family predicted phage head-tail adaptor